MAAQKTSGPDIARINALLSASQDRMVNLYLRWNDELQHEDFADYSAIMKSMLPDGFVFMAAAIRIHIRMRDRCLPHAM